MCEKHHFVECKNKDILIFLLHLHILLLNDFCFLCFPVAFLFYRIIAILFFPYFLTFLLRHKCFQAWFAHLFLLCCDDTFPFPGIQTQPPLEELDSCLTLVDWLWWELRCVFIFLFPRLFWVCQFLTFTALMWGTALSIHKPAATPLAPSLCALSCMLNVQIMKGRKGVFPRRHFTSLLFCQGGSLRLVSCFPSSSLSAWALLASALLLPYLPPGAPAERQLPWRSPIPAPSGPMKQRGSLNSKPCLRSQTQCLPEMLWVKSPYPEVFAGLQWEQWGTPAPPFPKDLLLLPQREEGRRAGEPSHFSFVSSHLEVPLLGPPRCTHRCHVHVLWGARVEKDSGLSGCCVRCARLGH